MNFNNQNVTERYSMPGGLNVTGDGRVVAKEVDRGQQMLSNQQFSGSSVDTGRIDRLRSDALKNGTPLKSDIPLGMDDARNRANKSGYNGARYLTPEESAEISKSRTSKYSGAHVLTPEESKQRFDSALKKNPWMREGALDNDGTSKRNDGMDFN